MWTSAFLVALVAGLWSVLIRVPLEVITILSKRESKPVAWLIMILHSFSDVLYYAPIVPAAITGALLGNIQTGLMVGGTVQLMFIGVFIVGASVPPNPFMAAILSTAFSILTGASTGETIALIVPVAIFSQLLTLGFMSVNVIFTHWADKMAADGNTKGLDLLNTLNGMGWDLVNVFPAFFAVGLGVDLAKGWLAAIPGWLSDGLGYTGGVLPALGFGMLLLIIANAEVWPFFFIGFLAAVYLKINAIAGAVLGLALALVYLKLQSGKAIDFRTRNPTPVLRRIEMSEQAQAKKVSQMDLMGALWRTYNFAGNYNFERLMALGMTQVMIPIFRSLGINSEDLKQGYMRHMVFYNTHPYFGALIMGIMVAMEEAKANGEPVTDETINGLKIAMMGPFAGTGDSLFWGTYHPIILAISANLALAGSVLSLFIATIGIGGMALAGHYFPFMWGYRGGVNFISRIHQTQILQRFTLGARIVAMTVAGVMVATLINISTPLVLFKTEAEKSGIAIQPILDQVLPKLLPLSMLFLVYWLLRRRISPVWVMVILMVVTVAFKAMGIFG